jgi:hypothetical protein
MGTTAAILGCRNDDYKEDERVIVCLNSMIETFDEIYFCDWNTPSDKEPLLWKIKDYIPKTGKIKHFIISEKNATYLTDCIPNISPFYGTLAYNLLIRRCTADWIASTMIDIIAPKKENLDNFLSVANKDTFYSVSRRNVEYSELEKIGFDNWKEFRDKLDIESEPRYWPAKVTPNDEYSLINCCGDFQLAHRDIWHKIKGFEEQMVYACFNDTNVQKKAVLNGFRLEAYYDLPLYHLSHKNMVVQGGDLNTLHENAKKTPILYNDAWNWVEWFNESQNDENWGLADTDIEFEII